MKDAGYKHPRHPEASIHSADGAGDSKIYPSMSVDHKSMPHLKKHNVGDTGEMHIKYKVTRQHQYKSGEGDTSFDVTHYEPAKRVKGKTDKELDDKAAKDEEGQPKADQD